jgi:glyoxylase-like metal-dependent hydrolase (beta-lactamase superfamily II)
MAQESRPDLDRIVAPNPGPMTLEGTNTYVVGRDPATVIDPGPADEGHIEKVRAAAEARGGLGEVVLTHSHGDHSDGVAMLGAEARIPADGEVVGGLLTMSTPGHAADHVCFLLIEESGSGWEVCFTGDLVLGEGSSIVPPRELGGSLEDYLDSLRRLIELDLKLLLPGHGPAVKDPHAKLREYLEHRLDRQSRLEAALERGERSRQKLLAEVWDDVPAELQGAAAYAMQAHLELLEAQGKLPGNLAE